ncbi:MAG TPA: P1 family peptidase, partial [Gemmatimonadaceae bacterium]|nr:P1 family peptidase [Gemmatimonadaceae bacterium]
MGGRVGLTTARWVWALLGWVAVLAVPAVVAAPAEAQPGKPRARDLGLPIGGTPGPLDAITDVPGVEVGHTTLISGSGKLVVGTGPVRTGVTVIHPRGKANAD